jgi:hypothetical protein
VHHEYEAPPTDVPEIGVVYGPLEYVTSRAAGEVDMGKIPVYCCYWYMTGILMIEQDGAMVFVETPYMIFVDAKRTQDLDKADSKAQLLAQIRSLQIQWFSHPASIMDWH